MALSHFAPKPFKIPIYVTRPLLPELKQVQIKLGEIWKSQILTNGGPHHEAFEQTLKKYLGVPFVSLFCNGTLALQLALNGMRLGGEVITTPFTFPGTPHVLHWNNIKPVFCDIDPKTLNLDADQIESLITPRTTAILPVHVYGTACDVEKIQQIARRHKLKVVYDAAHAFGVRVNGIPIGTFGDASMFSFHATKIFHTFEGGAICTNNADLKAQLDLLKNFGIKNQEEVTVPGINAKLNEVQSAIGLLILDMIAMEIEKRKKIYNVYHERLGGIEGITFLQIPPGVETNHQYMPILIDEKKFGRSRDYVYDRFRAFNVFARKYFYPLCSHYSFYSLLPSSQPDHLPVAERVADQVLCLPIYGTLKPESIATICDLLLSFRSNSKPC